MRYKNAQFTFDRVISNLHAFLPALTDEDRSHIDLHIVASKDNYDEISEFVRVASDLGNPQVSIGHCMAPFEQMFIEPSGKTAPCCFMGNERVENVYQDGFEAVWFSDVIPTGGDADSLPDSRDRQSMMGFSVDSLGGEDDGRSGQDHLA